MTSDAPRFSLGILDSFAPPAWLAADDRLHGEDWWNGRYFEDKARRLERAGFDYLFFLDTIAVRRRSDGSMAGALRHASTAPQHDPLFLLPILARATTHLGLVATASTTFFRPYQLARAFSTLDSLCDGRIGWNIVTSYERAEARNMGVELPPHDERYDRADEFLEAAVALWESWDADAVVADLESDTYIDPARVRSVDHSGRYFRTAGPLNTVRSPQGVPFLAQAGASPRGREFAARHAELTFVEFDGSPDHARAVRDDVRDRARHAGRSPDDIRVVLGCNLAFVPDGWDPTEPLPVTEAQVAGLEELMSQGFDTDFSAYPMDEPFPADAPPSGVHSMWERFIAQSRAGLTLRETIVSRTRQRDPATLRGTPEEVAERMIEIVEAVGGDGIMITNDNDCNEAFLTAVTERLCPVLRDAGAIGDRSGATLRERMGTRS